MKRLIVFFTLLLNFLYADTYYMILGEPIIGKSTSSIVNDAIYLGYSTQIEDLIFRIMDNGDSIVTKYMGESNLHSDNPTIKSFLEADKKAKKELDEFIKLVHKKISQKDSKKSIKLSFKKVSLKSKISSFNFKVSNIIKVNKTKFLNENFKDVMNRIKRIYNTNEFVMPFYTQRNRNIVGDYELKTPNLFFYEYYIPQIRGRRYFLEIYIYIINIDKDGTPSFEYKQIKEFNWERNYRFIAAQAGYEVRELIKNKLGVDLQ